MADEAKLSPDEVSQRIVAGMSFVHDLFSELDTLCQLIVQGLEASDVEIRFFGKKGFLLPKAPGRTLAGSRFLKTDMGINAEIGVGVPDDADDSEDEEEDIEEGEEDSESDKAKAFITPESQILAVRVVVFDPKATDRDNFTPSVVAAVLSNLTYAPTGRKRKGEVQETFTIKRALLKRLTRECDASHVVGTQVSRQIPHARLGAVVAAATTKPLAAFNSEDAVNEFVEELVKMIEN